MIRQPRGALILLLAGWQCSGRRAHSRIPQPTQPHPPARRPRTCSQSTELGASLRAEAEAPFRSLRVALFGAGTVSAGLATLFTLPQMAATLAHAPNAKSPAELGLDIAINLGALAFCGYFLRADLQVRGGAGWGAVACGAAGRLQVRSGEGWGAVQCRWGCPWCVSKKWCSGSQLSSLLPAVSSAHSCNPLDW